MSRQPMPPENVSALYGRSRGRCEHPDHTADCDGWATVIHHKARRKGPDPHRLDNLLHVSQACHLWLHAHPTASYANGSLVRHNGPIRPHVLDTP